MSKMGGETIDDENNDDICSIEGSEWTFEATSIGTIEDDENAQLESS
jgi:hypothetical protein